MLLRYVDMLVTNKRRISEEPMFALNVCPALALVSRVFIWIKQVNPGDDLEMRTALFVDFLFVPYVPKTFHYEARPIAHVDIILISS